MSEPVREECVRGASVPRVGLFSHIQEDEAFERRRPLVGEGVDWRATAFSAGPGNAPGVARDGGA